MKEFNLRQKLVRRGSGYLVYIPKEGVPNDCRFVNRYLTKNKRVILEFF